MITQLFQFFDSISNDNQMIAGAISLWFMGTITFIVRYLPQLLSKFFIKHLSTSLILTSQNQSFHTITRYLEENDYTKKFRRLKLRNGRHGTTKKTTLSVGQGWHWIWFAYRPIWIHVEELETENEFDKERITLVILGRNNQFFERFLNSIYPDVKDLIEVNIASEHGWEFSSYQMKRKLESVIIERDKLSLLVNRIENFISSEDWYRKHGIPYTLGILLYGPPGTGKTSLIRAIASKTNRKLYIVSAVSLTTNPSILLNVPDESIVVLEDIDSCINTMSRDSDNKGKCKSNSSNVDNIESLLGAYSNISDLLNALDGLCSCHGRILFMTTNHPEKLDKAILRPGRCDLKIELGYMNLSTFVRYMQFHFPDEDWTFLSQRELNTSTLTCAELQNQLLQHLSPYDIVQKYTKERKI